MNLNLVRFVVYTDIALIIKLALSAKCTKSNCSYKIVGGWNQESNLHMLVLEEL